MAFNSSIPPSYLGQEPQVKAPEPPVSSSLSATTPAPTNTTFKSSEYVSPYASSYISPLQPTSSSTPVTTPVSNIVDSKMKGVEENPLRLPMTTTTTSSTYQGTANNSRRGTVGGLSLYDQQVLLHKVMPNIRDIAVSHASGKPLVRVKEGLLFRSARPFATDTFTLGTVLCDHLKIRSIIDLRDDDLSPSPSEFASRISVMQLYRLQMPEEMTRKQEKSYMKLEKHVQREGMDGHRHRRGTSQRKSMLSPSTSSTDQQNIAFHHSSSDSKRSSVGRRSSLEQMSLSHHHQHHNLNISPTHPHIPIADFFKTSSTATATAGSKLIAPLRRQASPTGTTSSSLRPPPPPPPVEPSVDYPPPPLHFESSLEHDYDAKSTAQPQQQLKSLQKDNYNLPLQKGTESLGNSKEENSGRRKAELEGIGSHVAQIDDKERGDEVVVEESLHHRSFSLNDMVAKARNVGDNNDSYDNDNNNNYNNNNIDDNDEEGKGEMPFDIDQAVTHGCDDDKINNNNNNNSSDNKDKDSEDIRFVEATPEFLRCYSNDVSNVLEVIRDTTHPSSIEQLTKSDQEGEGIVGNVIIKPKVTESSNYDTNRLVEGAIGEGSCSDPSSKKWTKHTSSDAEGICDNSKEFDISPDGLTPPQLPFSTLSPSPPVAPPNRRRKSHLSTYHGPHPSDHTVTVVEDRSVTKNVQPIQGPRRPPTSLPSSDTISGQKDENVVESMQEGTQSFSSPSYPLQSQLPTSKLPSQSQSSSLSSQLATQSQLLLPPPPDPSRKKSVGMVRGRGPHDRNSRKLFVINILDSPYVKQRIMDTLTSSSYLPLFLVLKLSDKLTGSAFAPYYFCKYFVSMHNVLESYMEMLKYCGDNFCRALKLIVSNEPPILFHCTLGKDRTGIVAMLVLHILGASEEAIVYDYSLTEEAGDAFREFTRNFIIEQSGLAEKFCSASPETAIATIEFLKASWGSIDGYLDWIRFDSLWRAKLRTKYLVEEEG